MPPETSHNGLRTIPQRVANTLAYEAGAIAIVAPLIALTTQHSGGESMLFLIAVSCAFVAWAFVHNLLFDLIERSMGGGPASSRSHPVRIGHAVSLEVTSVVVTLPVVMYLGGFTFWEAVLVDIGLSLVYALYAYVFHLCYDHFYPVPVASRAGVSKVSM